ncbi:MAG TPA: DUF6520 family protein [Chitinophagaceae bacterium]|jgi:hypothetical protein|nr:DUF6520 family protein [Chitinophagaceae bacterium]
MKKYLIASIAVIIAVGLAAFTTKQHVTVTKTSPSTGYFHFIGTDNQQGDVSEYEYIGQMPPENDCSDNEVVCTVLAPLNDNGHPEDDSYWKPNFSTTGSPADHPENFSYLTLRTSSK